MIGRNSYTLELGELGGFVCFQPKGICLSMLLICTFSCQSRLFLIGYGEVGPILSPIFQGAGGADGQKKNLWLCGLLGPFVLTCLLYVICTILSLTALRSGTLYVKAAWATKFLRLIMYDKERDVCLCV